MEATITQVSENGGITRILKKQRNSNSISSTGDAREINGSSPQTPSDMLFKPNLSTSTPATNDIKLDDKNNINQKLQVKRKLDLEHKTILNSRLQAPPHQLIYTTFKAPTKITAIKPNIRSNCAAGRRQRIRSGPLPIAPAISCSNQLPPVPIPKNPNSRIKLPLKSPANERRVETSLGILTKRFVTLLRSSPEGILDLNQAAELLDVQKRRIYDITNVLEGIGLIEKKSKNNIKWVGTKHLEEDPEIRKREELELATNIVLLHQDINAMKLKEDRLDQLIEYCHKEMKMLNSENSHQCSVSKELNKNAYVTYQDIRGIKEFDNKTVIAVKAPPETKLEVPDPKDSIQIWLKSNNGPIDVYLCPDNNKENVPPKDGNIKSSQDDSSFSDTNSTLSDFSPLKTNLSNSDFKDNILTNSCCSDTMIKTNKREETNSCTNLRNTRFNESCMYHESQETNSSNVNTTLSLMNSTANDAHGHIKEEFDNKGEFSISPLTTLIPLEPNFKAEDYLFSLDSTEGINDLFDMDSFL